ncbi:MAG: hypothetical protein K0S47_3928 [Herbinix sp.]|jgi:hypothetical protein|nr:hypothetical protein [Herbinix sp.]
MFKKIYLPIFSFAPLIFGYLHNWMISYIINIPIIFFIYWYVFPVLMALFWFWVGGKFAQSNVKIFISVLLGNLVGIISLLVYFWQYFLISDSNRNITLAPLSLMFSSTISIFIARLAYLFQPNKNVIDSLSMLSTIQIMGLMLMIIIFTIGYYYKKRKINSVNKIG